MRRPALGDRLRSFPRHGLLARGKIVKYGTNRPSFTSPRRGFFRGDFAPMPFCDPTGDSRRIAPLENARSGKRRTIAGLRDIMNTCGLGDDGLPIGLQLVGAGQGERELLAAAAWGENSLSQRV